MRVLLKYSLLFLIFVSFTEPDESKTKQAIKNGIHFLKKIQRNDGAICDSINSLFDTWETIMAAHALYDIEKDSTEPCFNKALNYLRANENQKGLICHNKKCKQAYCLETSSEYFLLLIKLGLKEKIKSRLQFIKELQKPSGEWEIGNPDVNEEKTFPSVTAFVLQIFSEANESPAYQTEAYNWLMNKQNIQAHWGNTWEYYNCPAYALWAALQIKTNNKQFISAKERANAYILKSQNKNGSWNYVDLNNIKAPSAELQTALMINAIGNNDSAKNKAAVNNGIIFLLAKQGSNGGWDGGYFPIKNTRYNKKEYVFATALSLIAINNLLHKK